MLLEPEPAYQNKTSAYIDPTVIEIETVPVFPIGFKGLDDTILQVFTDDLFFEPIVDRGKAMLFYVSPGIVLRPEDIDSMLLQLDYLEG